MDRIKIYLTEKDALKANKLIKSNYKWVDGVTKEWCMPMFDEDEEGNAMKDRCYIMVEKEHLELLSEIKYEI